MAKLQFISPTINNEACSMLDVYQVNMCLFVFSVSTNEGSGKYVICSRYIY